MLETILLILSSIVKIVYDSRIVVFTGAQQEESLISSAEKNSDLTPNPSESIWQFFHFHVLKNVCA
jgi:hypothetical protein